MVKNKIYFNQSTLNFTKVTYKKMIILEMNHLTGHNKVSLSSCECRISGID